MGRLGQNFHAKALEHAFEYTKMSNHSSASRTPQTEDAGHIELAEGTILQERYRVRTILGDGTFGRVFEVEDIQEQTFKALKVIRAVERYVDAAKIEAEILRRVNRADPEDQSHIVRLYDEFSYGSNYCLVFERLGCSLFDVIKKNRYKGTDQAGFAMSDVISFTKQMLKAISFMHSLRLTHTDLKPENILLVKDQLDWDSERVSYDQVSISAHRHYHPSH